MLWNALYLLDLFAIAIFLISYYRNCYRFGYRIDFWHAQLFLYCVLPNMVMLPFAKGELNAVIVGSDFDGIVRVLPVVFVITIVGYLAMLFGGYVWDLQIGIGARRAANRLLAIGPRCSIMMMSSCGLLVFQSVLCVFLQILILSVYFANSGFAFDLRSYTFANPSLRPVALVISNYSVILASHCLARYVERKEKVLLACTLVLSLGLVFFGSRGNLIAVYINIVLCYLVQRRGTISLVRIVGLVAGAMAFGFYLGNVRSGQYSLGEFFSSLIILAFYGNNLSDLRDFAWVYADWNHVFWFGKTYLAGLTAFVPRFASEFRDTWGLGVATGITIGVDPQVHPGVRPGQFGEGFLNFGLPGVLLVGILVGIVVRRVDLDVKKALQPPRPSMMKAFASTMLISVAGAIAISANLVNLYVLGGAYLFSWFCLRLHALVSRGQTAPVDAT